MDKPSSFIPVYNGMKPILESELCVPSAVHAYSIGVQYFRDWFLKCMKGYEFKTIFVNGRHIMNDYMSYSTISSIKKSKPAVAFTPVPDMQYDRDRLDKYMGGKDMLIRRFNNQQGFFKDYENNIFLGIGIREQRINFSTRCRVESRAQQLDLYRKIELNCRIGFTSKDFISADFHIPYSILANVARVAGFELDENNNIKEPFEFVKYLNKHSENPITYKFRGINGRGEFFLRAKRVYCHIDHKNDLNFDDGETEGKLQTNFEIDFDSTLSMWVPSYYIYTSGKPDFVQIPLYDDSTIGLYTCKVVDIPEVNEFGWNKYFYTEYQPDEEEMKQEVIELNLYPLFEHNESLIKVLKHTLKLYESPEKFINISIFNYNGEGECYMDWDKYSLILKNNTESRICIAGYLNTEYINSQLSIIEKINETRLS